MPGVLRRVPGRDARSPEVRGEVEAQRGQPVIAGGVPQARAEEV